MMQRPDYEWLQEGSFLDADGSAVGAYDDIILLRDIPIEGDDEGSYRIPAGTIGTVLFFQREPDGVAELECYWPKNSFSFGFEKTRRLRLHKRAREKLEETVG